MAQREERKEGRKREEKKKSRVVWASRSRGPSLGNEGKGRNLPSATHVPPHPAYGDFTHCRGGCLGST